MPESRASFKLKSLSGRRFGVGGESSVSAAAALALAQAKLKVVSAQFVTAGSNSTGLDLTAAGNSAGHNDAADGLNLVLKTSDGMTRTLHIPQVSTSYKASINDGSVDITNADILDIVTKYNTATGLTFILQSGHYTQEG